MEHGLEISVMTEDHWSNRGQGIQDYLEEHPEIDEYVILDDYKYDFEDFLKFRSLSFSEKMDVLDYIAGASLYEVIENDGKEYRLVHAGLSNFASDKDLDEYESYDFLEERADYSRRYYPDKNIFLVTGHTPTVLIDGWRKPEVYRMNGHIAMDCACVAGGKLAAFCVETEEVIYVEGL